MKEVIKEQGINRVVVASCTPRTHEPLFQETCAGAGLNRYLFEMANIRDQCSWVHTAVPAEATEKAKNLIAMAVNKAYLLKPLERLTFPLTKKALVIGGGIAGMTAALGIAQQGFEVALVEREEELGGHLRHIRYTLSGEDPQKLLEDTIAKVKAEPNVKLFTSTKIKNIDGYIGNYKTLLETPAGEEEYEHGVVIVCTGGVEHKPNEYLYGQNERVLTQSEFENKLADGDKKVAAAKNVVMIQCVGSRCDERPYCSRFCCTQAVKNALKLKEFNPDANIYVLYRDIRTYGMRELAYKEAREKGVIFITYEPEDPPAVEERDGKLYIQATDRIIKERIGIPADYLVLSVATVPQKDTKDLAQMLKIDTNAEEFYLEAHMKLRPVDFTTDGVFMAGLCHFPKFIEESIVQANAAVSRACTVLTLEQIEASGTISEVNTVLCSACGMCEEVCPYLAVKVVEVTRRGVTSRYAEVTGALCKGCGICAASCRSGAIDIKGFTNAQITALVDAM
jgi:heterodisulfide reductase subunit A